MHNLKKRMGFDTTILEALVLAIIGGAVGYKGKDAFNSISGNGVAAGAVAVADAGADAGADDEDPRKPWYSNYFKRRQEETPALETAALAAEMSAREEETPVLAEETPVYASDEPAALSVVYEFDGHIHLLSDPKEKQTPAVIKIFLSDNPEINPGDLMFEIITDSGLTYYIKRHGYTDLLDKTSPSEIPRVQINKKICLILVQTSDRYRSYTFTINSDVCDPNVMSVFQNELKYNQYQLDTTTVPIVENARHYQDKKETAYDIFKRSIGQRGGSRRRKKSSNRRQSRRR